MDIISIIQENSLTVRCLPHQVVNVTTYRDGDEERIKRKRLNGKGEPIESERSIISGYGNWPPERKFVKEVIKVEKGGWWYVKETKNTMSTVTFSRKLDKFFAPTLEEAIELYLESKNK